MDKKPIRLQSNDRHLTDSDKTGHWTNLVCFTEAGSTNDRQGMRDMCQRFQKTFSERVEK